ncbi:hypothetical protein QTI17_27160 [Variovorax sp. J31P179]|uniref:hypothetical protein n=1 Tax=Variovorax sp. J31P179 TaxID=3053508 RepID=UPI002574D53A|nr:hypothetical protein [Variovorax sp. J31P179]MDM0084287.1 hypothetical protein [Variovorax sp. J31P179]
MTEYRRGGARTDRLATGGYAPRPVRSLSARAAIGALACASCLAVGAAAATWQARQGAAAPPPCVAPPPSEDLVQAELARTRLALAQEESARLALQKTADEAAAEVTRLRTELSFLRGQGAKRR